MKLKVNVAEDPLTCVAMGAGVALHNVKEYRRVFIN